MATSRLITGWTFEVMSTSLSWLWTIAIRTKTTTPEVTVQQHNFDFGGKESERGRSQGRHLRDGCAWEESNSSSHPHPRNHEATRSAETILPENSKSARQSCRNARTKDNTIRPDIPSSILKLLWRDRGWKGACHLTPRDRGGRTAPVRHPSP